MSIQTEEQVATGGHDFSDADVVAAEQNLLSLLRDLDDLGVTMVEADFRALSDSDKSLTRNWVECRKAGQMILCPLCLDPFATQVLMDERADHADEQEQIRKVLMRCTYGKPSPTKDEEGNSKIKMTLKIPKADVSPGTADRLWGYQRIFVEFGLLSVADWAQLHIPGTEHELIECEAEISGYSCTRHDWKFSFLVPHDEDHLTPDIAFDEYWKNNGSCRVTALGTPKDKDPVVAPVKEAKHVPLEGQKQLPIEGQQWNPVADANRKVSDEDGCFDSPDEYLVPLTANLTTCELFVGIGKDNLFYVSSDFYCTDQDGEESADMYAYGYPAYKAGTGFHSLQEAAAAEIGRVIDRAAGFEALPVTISELKDYLRHVENGGDLTPMPE